jgi:hypothetical protein
MKKIFFVLCALIALTCNAQKLLVNGFKHVVTGPTVFWQLGIQNEFQTTGPTGWKYIYGTPTNISTAGNVSFSGIQTSTGGSPTISFTNGSGFITYYTGGNTGSNTGIFNDEIIGNGWTYSNGATFTLGGLTVGQTYWLYILFNAHSWENANCSFTVAGQTSNVINNSENYGSSSTSPWYTSTALASKQFTCTSASQVVTLNSTAINSSNGVIAAAVLAK